MHKHLRAVFYFETANGKKSSLFVDYVFIIKMCYFVKSKVKMD